MASYNWDPQDTILRWVTALQARGYTIWVDVEQMMGSTVDAMAEAVEGAEVMLIGVSRAYKESSNWRREAQYGMQRQKDMIPLMMQEGYQADGWLGMLLGTKLWHPLFGEMLSSETVFEDRMSALAREIGTRGRADAVMSAPPGAEPPLETDNSEEACALRSELEEMRLTALQKRAVSEGVSADAVDGAMDGDDPKSSLVALIIELASTHFAQRSS
jgi:male-specific lethal 1